MAPIKLRDGEVTLYARGDSANWYAGFRLIEGGRLQESMKTRNQRDRSQRHQRYGCRGLFEKDSSTHQRR